MSDITLVLNRMKEGDPRAPEDLLALVYEELRTLAIRKMARESSAYTLQPTALVHEAWLRLGGADQPAWANRAHFFSAAAEAMRRILIDDARRRRAERHGGRLERADPAELDAVATDGRDDQLLAVHEALEKFAALDPEKAELVKLRYFVGLTIPEAAETLGISEATAKRWWFFARAWLYRQLQSDGGLDGAPPAVS